MQQKNTEIELYRFFMCTAILILHCSEDYFEGHTFFLPRGYLAVEFFFLLSGYLLYEHFRRMDRANSDDIKLAINYWCGRFKRLFFPLLIASAIMLAGIWIDNNFDIMYIGQHIWNIKWQFLFLHHVGAPFGYVMRSAWYLSPLMLVSWVLYTALLINWEKTALICPALSILIYAYFAHEKGSLTVQESFYGMIDGGVLLALAGMSLGLFGAVVVNAVQVELNVKSVKSKCLLMVCRVVAVAIVFYCMQQDKDSLEDFAFVFAAWMLICVSFIDPLVFKGKLGTIINYLGSLSLWIYLLHNIVSLISCKFIPGLSYVHIILVDFIGTIILSVICERVYARV